MKVIIALFSEEPVGGLFGKVALVRGEGHNSIVFRGACWGTVWEGSAG